MNTKIKRLAAVAGLAMALGVSACSTAQTVPPVTYTPPPSVAPATPVGITSGTPAATSSPAPAGRLLPGATAKVGGTFQAQDSNGNTYDVTLVKVIDPASPDANGFPADAGRRLVGLVFRIKGVDGTASDDANTDAAVTGSDQQQYQPYFDSIAGYTNFNYGQWTVNPGQVSIGDVTLEVPNGVKVAAVTWQPTFTGDACTWTVG